MTSLGMRKKIIKLSTAISAIVVLCLSTIAIADLPDIWPHENSDISADPNIQYGQLSNGLRFAVMPNQTPANQASIRFLFDVGSKYEREDEKGMAHFLEHMAFNGSENIPEGEMVKILERLGLAFGADTNASTSYEQTVYQLDLPNTEAETMSTAFSLMREVASNLSIDPAALDRERGVILAEKRRTNVEQLENAEQQYNFISPDNRFFQRLPIGAEDTINSISAEQMLQFYHQFYRPDNAFLVMVGDFDADQISDDIESAFGDWESVGDERDTAYANITEADSALGLSAMNWQSPNATAQLSLTFTRPLGEKNDSQEERINSYLDFIANSSIARSMGNLQLEGKVSYLAAGTSISPSYDNELELTALNLVLDENNWQQGFEEGYAELKRVLSYGFTQGEVDLSIATLQTILSNAETSAQQRPNPVLANFIMSQFFSNQVANAPAIDLEIFNAFVGGMTPEAVSAYFNPHWENAEPKLFFLTKSEYPGLEENLLASFTKAQGAIVTQVVEEQQAGFAYTNFGEPGSVKNRSEDDSLDATFIRFDNNVMLNLKKTDFQNKQVLMTVRFGGGLLSVPKTNSGLMTMIGPAFSAGGTNAHSMVELPQVLAGKQVSVNLAVGEDSFQFVAPPVSPEDVLLQLQLWLGFMTDAAYREEPVELVKRQISAVYANLDATAPQVAQIRVPVLLHGNDPRFGLPPQEELLAISGAEVGRFLAEQIASSAIEITLVGDIDIQRSISAVAATFGTLPVRNELPLPYTNEREISFPDSGLESLSHNGDPSQAVLQMYWPTVDYSNTQTSAGLDVLSALLSGRVRDAVREELGASYAPGVFNVEDANFPEFGYFAVSLDAKTEDVDMLSEVVRSEIRKVIREGFSSDELDRARQPLIARAVNREKTNPYWLNRLAQAQTAPERLAYQAIILDVYNHVTGDEVQGLAADFLSDETVLEVRILPNSL